MQREPLRRTVDGTPNESTLPTTMYFGKRSKCGLASLNMQKCEHGLYRVPRGWDGSKRCARLVEAGKQNEDVLRCMKYNDMVFDEPGDMVPFASKKEILGL